MIASKRLIKQHHALPHDDFGVLNFSVFKTDSKANTLTKSNIFILQVWGMNTNTNYFIKPLTVSNL